MSDSATPPVIVSAILALSLLIADFAQAQTEQGLAYPPDIGVADGTTAGRVHTDKKGTAKASIAFIPAPLGSFEFIAANTLTFEAGSARLSDTAKKTLRAATQYLIYNNTVKRVLIDGYSDNTSDIITNEHLSEKRARSVRDYLISQGVPTELLLVRGWGETHPIDENWNPAGRQRNRRVELHIISSSAGIPSH